MWNNFQINEFKTRHYTDDQLSALKESALVVIAEMNQFDKVASAAMKELRVRFDSTYFWCLDCDGLVVKKKDCCLTQEVKRADLKTCPVCKKNKTYGEICEWCYEW